METTINPKTLKLLRTQQNLTQEQLAERIPCSTAQVSRWERGKNLRLRTDLRKKLAKSLRTDWETLTRPPIDVPQDELAQVVPKEQLNVRVEKATKTALELVCLRFGVKPSLVIDLAPLLFLITAENSLRDRKQRLKAAWDLMSDAEKISLPHVGQYVFYGEWDDRAWEEEGSIAKRDIFANTLEGWAWNGWDEERDCPYSNYLRDLATELLEEGDAVAEISPNYGTAPKYKIALDTFLEATGIDDSTERNKRLRERIFDRYIKLQDVIDKRQELNEDEFQIWLDEAQNEVSEQVATDLKSYVNRHSLSLEDLLSDNNEGNG